jgi:putative transposase
MPNTENEVSQDGIVSKGRRKKSRSDELLDELIAEYGGSAGVTGPDGLLKDLTRRLVNRAMGAEMTQHLGYEAGDAPPVGQSNRRNGKTEKTVRTGQGQIAVEVPRDRDGSFEPQLIPKHQRHFDGFDDKILSMYARGMTVREIRAHLEEIYGVDVSPDLISRVTDAVIEEMTAWQTRPLEPVYLIAYLDALVIKVRDKSGVQNKSVYIVVGVRPDGSKDVLGFWLQATEGAKFWLTILTELRQRGVEDILVLCADGLTGMAEAVEAAFPRAIFQTCIVHMVRSSTRFVPWKERKAVCADLRTIYTAETAEAAEAALDGFERTWGKRYPMIVPAWRRRWDEITPFLAFPMEIRRAIYTTNAVEALNRQLRKVLKIRGHMPNEQAALKLLFMAVRNAHKNWGGRDKRANTALLQFAIYFEGRIHD